MSTVDTSKYFTKKMVFVNQILGVILKETLILVQNYVQHYMSARDAIASKKKE